MEELKREFELECDQIAAGCETEGYPIHGSNYDLRVDALMRSDYYAPLFPEYHAPYDGEDDALIERWNAALKSA